MSAEGGGDVVVTQEHFTSDLRVARLIGTKQRNMSKTVKVEDDESEKEEKMDSLGKRWTMQVYSRRGQ
jgi:hypothetical protein